MNTKQVKNKQQNLYLRLIIFGVCLGLDLILGYHFITAGYLIFPENIRSKLELVGISTPSHTNIPTQIAAHTEPNELLAKINERRDNNLQLNSQLTLVAQHLINNFAQDNWQIANNSYQAQLKAGLESASYKYLQATNLAIIGTQDATETAQMWLSASDTGDILLEKDYQHVGIATQKITEGSMAEQEIIVLVLAQPYPNRQVKGASTDKSFSASQAHVRDIPDNEVFAALNSYRAQHQIPQLVEDKNLCLYAEKRATDLATYGSLDGHAGFKADFADLTSLPIGIRNYSGGSIGENLASQFCLNSTTKVPFTASTGTSLIEWCFDSSTSGHREAQLNPKYTAACIRHAANMYVVIFGE